MDTADRSVGFLGLGFAALAVILAVGAPDNRTAPTRNAGFERGGERRDTARVEGRFSEEALRRAVTEQAWHEAVQARCAAPSPFAAPASLPPAC